LFSSLQAADSSWIIAFRLSLAAKAAARDILASHSTRTGGIVIIGLIGMSGAGKSSWASRLAAAGFTWLHCDELIADKLRANFDVGAGSVHDLGQWMGFPYEARYAQHEAIYLASETEVLGKIVEDIAQGRYASADLIIDLTGSAIYVDPEVLSRVRQAATIVYLAVSPKLHDRMVHDYIANPRPIIWKGFYRPQPHEAPAAALARCYPQLLADRERLYAELSHVTIADELHRSPEFDVGAFLKYVERGR
jgi:shikimate kinase